MLHEEHIFLQQENKVETAAEMGQVIVVTLAEVEHQGHP
jgi:hypothetical protein